MDVSQTVQLERNTFCAKHVRYFKNAGDGK
jgi:hypothetical protein